MLWFRQRLNRQVTGLAAPVSVQSRHTLLPLPPLVFRCCATEKIQQKNGREEEERCVAIFKSKMRQQQNVGFVKSLSGMVETLPIYINIKKKTWSYRNVGGDLLQDPGLGEFCEDT